jgi:hypothetical protein
VVLVPLTVLGAVSVAFWPAARRRYGVLLVLVAAVATACIPIATSSGEGLEHRIQSTAALQVHTKLGDQLLPFAGLLLVALVALVVLDRTSVRREEAAAGVAGGGAHLRRRPAARTGPGTDSGRTPGWVRPASIALSLLTVVLAAVTAVQVVRIGDSGARAAWGDQQYVQEQVRGGASGD